MRNLNELTNIEIMQFWQKLNRKPLSIYLRFQRMFAKHNNGKWVRGCSIDGLGQVKLILE
jgi:hypothetical protein